MDVLEFMSFNVSCLHAWEDLGTYLDMLCLAKHLDDRDPHALESATTDDLLLTCLLHEQTIIRNSQYGFPPCKPEPMPEPETEQLIPKTAPEATRDTTRPRRKKGLGVVELGLNKMRIVGVVLHQ